MYKPGGRFSVNSVPREVMELLAQDRFASRIHDHNGGSTSDGGS